MKVNQMVIIDKMAECGYMSKCDLASAAHVTTAALSRLMNKHTEPTQKTVFKIAAALKCQPSDILILD